MSTKAMNQHTRRRMELDSSFINERTYESPLVMEYVPGPHPYVWIGDNRGWCFATVDASKLRAFLRGDHNTGRTPDVSDQDRKPS